MTEVEGEKKKKTRKNYKYDIRRKAGFVRRVTGSDFLQIKFVLMILAVYIP